MLHDAYLAGVKEACDQFGIKEATGIAAAAAPAAKARMMQGLVEGIKGVPRMLFGHPDKVIQQGRSAFNAGGVLDPRAAFWPSVERGAGGERLPQIFGWLGRASTLASGYGAYKAMKGEAGDPNEGRLTNTLGSLGGALGMGFGMQAGGMLGAPILAGAGTSLGKGIGRILGSRPEPVEQDPLAYGQGVYR